MLGGGIFGTLASLEILKRFPKCKVILLEAGNTLFSNSTTKNQARIHNGLHYPRSIETAHEANTSYETFLKRFPGSVREIHQYYGITSRGSKTSPEDFLKVAEILNIEYELVDPRTYTRDGYLAILLKTAEATYDAAEVRNQCLKELDGYGERFSLQLNSEVRNIHESERGVVIQVLSNMLEVDHCVIAGYAMNNRFAKMLGVKTPATTLQLCEVLIGSAPELINTGITIMDGPFWSIMPYGNTNFHSLTNVLHTPLLESERAKNLLPCQEMEGNCGTNSIRACNSCKFIADSKKLLAINEFNRATDNSLFNYSHSMYTVKSIPSNEDHPTAARPTEIISTPGSKVHLIFSGKIASSISIAEKVSQLIV